MKKNIHIFLFFCACLCHAEDESIAFSKVWELGGGLTVRFQSQTDFEYTPDNAVQFGAHLPGFSEQGESHSEPLLSIDHTYTTGCAQINQSEGHVEIATEWHKKFPPDFIHLLYGAARLEWLRQGIYPVHAACIGNDKQGYVLLMGSPGSGKTSLVLHMVMHHGYQVFSGDKTLLRTTENGLEAIAGTHTITIRSQDEQRWTAVPKVHEHPMVDRLAYKLPAECYSKSSSVSIKAIIFIGLNDGVELTNQHSKLSALHQVFPFFMDKQREDVLIAEDQAFLDGTVSKKIRTGLIKSLKKALETVPVYNAVSSIETVAGFIRRQFPMEPKKFRQKKILYGICGIGNGHYIRQLPVLKHLLEKGHQIMLFTYGDALVFFRDRFPKHLNLTLVPVANPYYVGTPQGLDFEETGLSEKNRVDFLRINSMAMDLAAKEIGRPDLVISDYEMVAAQYAYTKNAPLITLDQQSKYLVGDFDLDLNGTSYRDEIERLSLFFPKAEKRLAVSFFGVKDAKQQKNFNVEVLSPMIRGEVLAAKGAMHSKKPTILVYMTSQQLGEQPVGEWIQTIRSCLPENFEAHIYLPLRLELPANDDKLCFYHHGDKRFDSHLFASHGIVTTAGHNLLSEAMYLEKPVYAIPLPLYEQQLNAHIIGLGGFGLCQNSLSPSHLKMFFQNLAVYSKNIREDTKYLLKMPGNTLIIEKIVQFLEEQ